MGALDGIRVLDFSRYGPGRHCTMFLADFGAEVITIEMPRNNADLPTVFTDDQSSRYLALNRNKKSLALNLRVPGGKEVIYQLVRKVDVVTEGFRPGTMKKLGLDYNTLKKLNPHLIYCSLSGYGQDGPYSLRPGHDVNYLGFSGILDSTRGKDGNPVLIGTQIADLGGGASQAIAGILLALLVRERTGKGQYIDVSMFDGIIAWHWTTGTEYLNKGKLPRRFFGESPAYNIYKSKDGKHITLGIMEPWFWERFCRAIEREDLIPYMEPSEKSVAVIAELEQLFRTRTRDEWMKLLSEIDIPCAPVNTIEEAFSDPQTLHRRMVLEVEQPRVGKLKLLGIPLKLSETPGKVRTLSPAYGEHTLDILGKLGYTTDDLKRLREAGAIE
jgi:crotonobetainyl-CoA:carnitine CoA-transferase CaiB-like acyl-CoA transferase